MKDQRPNSFSLLLLIILGGLFQSCLLEEDEQPKERRIVLQLDTNPKKIDFKTAVAGKSRSNESAIVKNKKDNNENQQTNGRQGMQVSVLGKSQARAKTKEKINTPTRDKGASEPRKGRQEHNSRPRLTMEGLLMKLEAVKLDRAKRGYRPGELPAVDEAVDKAEKLLDQDRLEDAAREIAKAQRVLDNFKIDQKYIEHRLDILNRDPRVSHLSGRKLQKVSKLLEAVNKAYMKGDYRKTNRIIDRIRQIIAHP
ncbi:MAG: hypothetical protein GXP49_02000 [Deltaproteobacteria bacterium]|nr:hypothetical protein [Deltaproteobacteria bacterium]